LYVVFVLLYSLWTLRLVAHFSHDRRLGYLLSLTDAAILLPLIVWSSGVAMQTLIALACVVGFAGTAWGAQIGKKGGHVHHGQPAQRAYREGTPLERAIWLRLSLYATTGSRFGVVVLRIVRFEETTSYYGPEASARTVTALSRRGLRVLGADAQHFILPGGRIAFVFAVESSHHSAEDVAMSLGRKVCEHLIDGRRVECVVGWAAAPADGLTADDLMHAAESGAQSTAAFRRVAGAQIHVPERSRVAAG